jgi:MinD-like ATPase involved in chromosome partitioning or flagellar assembly
VLVTLAFVAAAVLFGVVRPVTYAAEASVLLQDPRSSVVSSSTTPARDEVRYVADQIAILKSTALNVRASQLVPAVKGSERVSARELQRHTTIKTSEGSNVVGVRVTAESPEAAKVQANAIVRAYRELVRADLQNETRAALRRLDIAIAAVARTLANQARASQASAALTLLQELRSRRSSLQVDAQLLGDGVSLFLPAESGKPQGASLISFALIALVLGGLVGIGIAYMLDTRGQGFGRRLGVQAPVDPQTLAQIPDFEREGLETKLPVLDAPGSDAAESFRFLVATIGAGGRSTDGRVAVRLVESLQDEYPEMTERELAAIGRVASRLDVQTVETQPGGTKETRPSAHRTVAFVAASAGDGTSTLLANTALAAAQAGENVLVVDGDVGGRGLTRLLLGSYVPRIVGSDGKPIGLLGMILRGLQSQDVKRVIETSSGGKLSLIEPGSANLADFGALRPQQMVDALSAAGTHFDRVFIDTPPVLQVPYADALLRSSSAVVVIVPHRADPGRLEQVLDRLAFLGANAIGHVVNLVPPKRSSGRMLREERIHEAETRPVQVRPQAATGTLTRLPERVEEDWTGTEWVEPAPGRPAAERSAEVKPRSFVIAPPPEPAKEEEEAIEHAAEEMVDESVVEQAAPERAEDVTAPTVVIAAAPDPVEEPVEEPVEGESTEPDAAERTVDETLAEAARAENGKAQAAPAPVAEAPEHDEEPAEAEADEQTDEEKSAASPARLAHNVMEPPESADVESTSMEAPEPGRRFKEVVPVDEASSEQPPARKARKRKAR